MSVVFRAALVGGLMLIASLGAAAGDDANLEFDARARADDLKPLVERVLAAGPLPQAQVLPQLQQRRRLVIPDPALAWLFAPSGCLIAVIELSQAASQLDAPCLSGEGLPTRDELFVRLGLPAAAPCASCSSLLILSPYYEPDRVIAMMPAVRPRLVAQTEALRTADVLLQTHAAKLQLTRVSLEM